MDKIRILKTLSKQFVAQEKYEEAIKCLEAASNVVDALPVERATACLHVAILVLEYFEENDYARTKLLQAVRRLIYCKYFCILYCNNIVVFSCCNRKENWLQQQRLNSKVSCMLQLYLCWCDAVVRMMMR